MSGYVNAEDNVATIGLLCQAHEQRDVALLERICDPGIRLVEPEIFSDGLASFAEFRAEFEKEPAGEFVVLETEPIGDSILAVVAWTLPSGERQRWRVIYSFWDGRITRIDGKLIG